MPGLTHNAGDLIRKMNARSSAVARELAAAAREIAPVLNAEAKRIMQSEIYNVPEEESGTGRKKWQRSGALKRGENAKAEGVDVVMTNNQHYSRARNNLGTSEGRRLGKRTRSVQWQAQALANRRQWVLEVRRRAVLRALKSPV